MTPVIDLADGAIVWVRIAAILGAGFWAGMINTVVGSRTLVSFPVLLLCGYPPVTANVSNSLGLVAGGISGTLGYRRELRAHMRLAGGLLPASLAGAVVGALLLLVLPPEAFQAIVPALIALGLVMVLVGPTVQRRGRLRRGAESAGAEREGLEALPSARRVAMTCGVFVLGVYGGYFGAAQGILIVGLLSMLTTVGMQSLNAVKNLLATGVNLVAAVVFMVVASDQIDWTAALLIAVGAALGGVVGARFGRRLSPTVLRILIVSIGLVAMVNLLFFQ